jgi:hypothetical protein
MDKTLLKKVVAAGKQARQACRRGQVRRDGDPRVGRQAYPRDEQLARRPAQQWPKSQQLQALIQMSMRLRAQPHRQDVSRGR